jgi:phosphopantetheinyl transferase
MASETGLIGRHISPAAQRFIEETSGLGRIVMAHSMLGRAERQFWYSLPERGPRRVEWLMGRIVAKDAVRKWAAGHLNLFLAAVDIEIRQTEAGKPFAVCPHIQQDVPDVSISHSGGHTIALLAAEGQRIGTDYQLIANIRACQLPDIAFSETEHLHLRHSGPFLRDRSIITLWSVKEAAAKAAGTGLEGRPKEWRIEEFSMEEGRATVVRNANTFSCRFWSTAEFVFSVCCY